MGRRRRRIMRGRRRPRHVSRTLIVRLLRRHRVTHARPLGRRRDRPLNPRLHLPLGRRLVRPLDRPRRIGAPVRAIGSRPLSHPDGSARQYCAKPRRCALGREVCLVTNVDSIHWRNCAPIQIQRLLMIWLGHCSTQAPGARGHRSTIYRHQALRRKRVRTAAKDGPHGHDPTGRIVAHPNHGRPDSATAARSPSPAEGVIPPTAAMVRKPAPGIT